MNQIYLAEDNRHLIIYQHQHSVYLRTIFQEQAGKAALLCIDCMSPLTTTQYNNSIYYAYINKEHHLLIKSIADSSVLYRIPARNNIPIFNPHLITFQKHLVLCYVFLNPSTSLYQLKCFCPFEAGIQCKLNIACSTPPTFRIMTFNNTMVIFLSDSNDSYLYSVNEHFEVQTLIPQTKDSIDQEALQQQIQNELMQSFQQRTLALQNKIKSQEYIIESAKKQYNELMDTAQKYRDEAIKWRSKFTSE